MLDEQFLAAMKLEQLHQSRQCLSRSDSVEVFAPSITHLAELGSKTTALVHEMRNPLTTVLLGLSACQKLTLPESAKDRLSLALEEAERLQRLIDEVLLYARPLVLQRHELELNKLIKDILNLVSTLPVALERNIRFVGTASAVWIKGDRDRLKQLFINLASNACEAVSPGEEVCWKIELVQRSHQGLHGKKENAAQAWVSISNGGRPIEPEILPQITQPFVTTKAEGNGLGLAIAERIVEAHGGKLNIESSAQGTKVSVGFPVGRILN